MNKNDEIFDEVPSRGRTSKEFILWGFSAILVVAVLVFAASYVFTGLGWLTLPTSLYNAERVQELYTSYIERSNELVSLKAQINGLESEITLIKEKNAGYTGMGQWSLQDRADYDNYSKTRLGLITAYNRSCAQYNSDWQNWYKTSSVALTDLDLKLPEGCQPISN